MLTGEIRNQVNRIWDAFWSGGISNPLEVIEQITYLLFLKRLDDLHLAEELKANKTKKPMQRQIFPTGKDKLGIPYEQYRWSRFKNREAREMYEVISDHVFPWLRTLGGDGSNYATHMKDARFTIPTPALLAKVVDLIEKIPMEDRDTKGDLYEYMPAKIASAGQNGQFRTPPPHHPVNGGDGRARAGRRGLRPGLWDLRISSYGGRIPAGAPPRGADQSQIEQALPSWVISRI